jgi:hypothetical protein
LALFAIEVDGENVADAVVVQGAGRCVLTLSGGSVIHAR